MAEAARPRQPAGVSDGARLGRGVGGRPQTSADETTFARAKGLSPTASQNGWEATLAVGRAGARADARHPLPQIRAAASSPDRLARLLADGCAAGRGARLGQACNRPALRLTGAVPAARACGVRRRSAPPPQPHPARRAYSAVPSDASRRITASVLPNTKKSDGVPLLKIRRYFFAAACWSQRTANRKRRVVDAA